METKTIQKTERTEAIQKIGIMGGTFNPIHNGHLMIAENAREQFGLNKVLFIPTGHSPLRHKQHVTAASHRCNMVSLAISDNPWFVLDKTEVNSTEISYTYRTLQKLKEAYTNAKLYFILGADSLFDFESWREPEAILEHCNILAAYRKHERQEEFFQQIAYLNKKYPDKFYPLDTPSLEVASQDIRNRVQYGRTIRYLVPREVESYIREHHLYEGAISAHETTGN